MCWTLDHEMRERMAGSSVLLRYRIQVCRRKDSGTPLVLARGPVDHKHFDLHPFTPILSCGTALAQRLHC